MRTPFKYNFCFSPGIQPPHLLSPNRPGDRYKEQYSRATDEKVQRSGLSLLEVVLALSILGVTVGILSSVMQQSADNGLRSRRMTQAQLVCESKMSEAIAGALPLQSTPWTPVAGVDGVTWYYSLEVVQAEQPNLISIVISVNDDQAMAESARPLTRLAQWVIDPNLGLDVKPATTEAADSTGTTTGAAGGAL